MARHRPGRRTRKRPCRVCGQQDHRANMVRVGEHYYHERCSTYIRMDTLPPNGDPCR